MNTAAFLFTVPLALGASVVFAADAAAQDAVRLVGATCATPPILHCPDKDCPSDRVINQGPVVESGFDRIPATRLADAYRLNSEGWTQQMQSISRHVAATP